MTHSLALTAAAHAVTWTQLWPPLLLLGIAVALIGTAGLVWRRLGDDLGCIALPFLALPGVGLLVKAVSVLGDLLGRSR